MCYLAFIRDWITKEDRNTMIECSLESLLNAKLVGYKKKHLDGGGSSLV